ncbi:hypothetical protein [Alicyclobacillus fastidiosus]|uniref:Uncharacterized protein n=1 Tax=Alicyclobacillus fastidiosus TaxID=392011 RepID=A0ABV5AK45_9BACL|nr:hypothetical protein [Alicyclobacillus fastidiosus]WEH09266.1 hypothetical protein PYS47_21755 [Alicyclobacillus fastidiosus]
MPESLAVTAKDVILGGKPYTVRAVPVAATLSIIPALQKVFGNLREQAGEKKPVTFNDVLGKVLEAPHAIFSIFIDDLPEKAFTDPKHGATFPELLAAWEVILEVNRLDVLKNALTRLSTEQVIGMLSQASQYLSKS